MTFHFAAPWAFALLLALPAYWIAHRRARPPRIALPAVGEWGELASRGARVRARLPVVLRTLAWIVLVMALARPRTAGSVAQTTTRGISIVVAMDVSTSMLAEDFAPANRLEVAKRVTLAFVQGRPHDRVGIVTFAGEALTQVPVTTDPRALAEAVRGIQVGALEDGTAIGLGLATAVNRLRRVPGASRVAILLSDGENNRNEISPLDAAAAARRHGVRVFTIGVGSRGVARMPVGVGGSGYRYAFLPVRIDEELLTRIAASTGGAYFRAADPAALERVFAEIDRMVRSPIVTRRRRQVREWYLPLLLVACTLLIADAALRARGAEGWP